MKSSDPLDPGGIIFYGTGLGGYSGGAYPTTGTITGYESFDDIAGLSSTVVSGASVLASQFNTFVANNDDLGLQAALYGGPDTITGSANDDFLAGYGGADAIHAGNGNDSIVATSGVAGEVFDGGAGTDRLVVGDGSLTPLGAAMVIGSAFSPATLLSIEQLAFDTTSLNNAIFSSAQIGAGLSPTLLVIGDPNPNHVVVNLTAAATLNLSGWTFASWTPALLGTAGDQVTINGSDGADTVTGTNSVDLLFGDLTGAGGNDVLHGGAGGDFIRGMGGVDQMFGDDGNDVIGVNPGEFAAGEIIDGGNGVDTLNLNGTVDLTGSSVVGMERVTLQNAAGAANATFTAAQVNAGLASNLVLTGSATADRLVIQGTTAFSLNLSAWSFVTWTTSGAAADSIVIGGSGGADTVTLNTLAGAYTITLGGGSDTLALAGTGGQFLAANAITVTDFRGAPGGDQLELTAYLNSALQNYTANADPFLSGHLRLLQSGADTLLQVDRDGGGDAFSTLITLSGVDAFDLVAANLDGFASNIPRPAPLAGGPASETMTGGAGHDFLQGLGGNDLLVGAGGSDILDGGTGVDTAAYSSLRRAYVVSGVSGTVGGGPEGGIDTLANIERIKFVDGYLGIGTTDTAAQVYRIYGAALGRAPDATGLANWVRAIEQGGASLQTVANGFIGSQEFIGRFGAGDNTQFLTLLYANVLNRAPDQGGLQNWLTFLGTGHTRAEAVIGFSESQEYISGTAPGVQQGVWVMDANAAVTARLYDTVFGRLPDASGEANWTAALNSGTSLNTVANGFVASTEFQTTYGPLGNDAFVQLMYQNVLHRAADPSGLATWVGALNAGHSRAEVVIGFSESPEHIANTAPHIDDGVWFA